MKTLLLLLAVWVVLGLMRCTHESAATPGRFARPPVPPAKQPRHVVLRRLLLPETLGSEVATR